MARPFDNFTLIRLGLALAVVVSHAFSVTTGEPGAEPLVRATGFSLGEHAVNGFFAVSGFLVTMSYDRRGPRDYAVARLLRIVPAFVAADPRRRAPPRPGPDAAADARVPREPGALALRERDAHRLQEHRDAARRVRGEPVQVPDGDGLDAQVRGPVLPRRARPRPRRRAALARPSRSPSSPALALAVAALDLLAPEAGKGVQTALRLPLIFAAGGALYLWRDQVRLSGFVLAAALVATVLVQGAFPYRAALFLTEAYGVIWLALAPGLAHPALDPRADLSYGAYLYGWPIQQSLHQLWPAASAPALLGPAIGLTLAVAAASWFLVEKPALALKARLLGRPALTPISPAAP